MKINTTHRELPGVDFGLELGRDRGGGNEDGRKEGCNSEGGRELHCVRVIDYRVTGGCRSWCVANRPAMSCTRGVDEDVSNALKILPALPALLYISI